MKFISEFRDPDKIKFLSEKIIHLSCKKINIMEICGGHTMAIRKNGLDKLVGKNITFLSGPGCPVCVTPINEIDKLLWLAEQPSTVLCTFGDLYKVPGTRSNLLNKKAEGADIRLVYSVHDALNFADQEKNKNIIFAAIGFETTAPSTAAAMIEAAEKGINNFFVYSLHKTVPPAIRALLSDPENRIQAFILPGHVSTILGLNAYTFIPEQFQISASVSGFEPADILNSVYTLVELYENNKIQLFNNYTRIVKTEGNMKAKMILDRVFESCDSEWRGLGMIPESGLKIKTDFSSRDAEKHFTIPDIKSSEFKGCLCGEILKGKKSPVDCSLFNSICTPEDPKGACMVSSEGVCAAWQLYG